MMSILSVMPKNRCQGNPTRKHLQVKASDTFIAFVVVSLAKILNSSIYPFVNPNVTLSADEPLGLLGCTIGSYVPICCGMPLMRMDAE